MTLARCVVVESGLGWQFWFSPQWLQRTRALLGTRSISEWLSICSCTEGRRIYFSAGPSVANLICIWMRKGEEKASTFPEAINCGFATDHNISEYKLQTVYSVDTEDSNIQWGAIWWAQMSILQTGYNRPEQRRYQNQHYGSSTVGGHVGSIW